MVLLWATPASPDGVNVNPLASEAASPIDGWNVSPPIIVPEVLLAVSGRGRGSLLYFLLLRTPCAESKPANFKISVRSFYSPIILHFFLWLGFFVTILARACP